MAVGYTAAMESSYQKSGRYLYTVGRELHRTGRLFLLLLAAATVGLYAVSPHILHYLQAHLDQKLAFFSVAGPFLAHVKLGFFAAIFLFMPWMTLLVWRALSRPFGFTPAMVFWFFSGTCLLFYSGVLFCFTITLPYGVNFLLGFQSEDLVPVISITKFVSFVTIFLFAFGLIFELPIFMVFLAKVGLYPREKFEKNRRYAVLVISIIAALLTPTPDVVNMLLMGVPLYLLYEAGIVVIRILRY